MYIDSGTGTVVERNNIYDLRRSRTGYDVDGVRFWGDHTFRYNYIHDINEHASNGNPHVDCFQTYNYGTDSAGTLIENNYCLRVSRQCLIAQNNSADRYAIRDITFRNNILVRVESRATIYRRAGDSTGENFRNNREILDTTLNDRDSDFHDSRPPYPSTNPDDFARYRAYAQNRDIVDEGIDIDHADTDVDGNPRIDGSAIDLGPFEIR